MFDGILIASLSILKHTKSPIHCFIMTMDLTDQNPDYSPISDKQIEYFDQLYKSVNTESLVTKLDATTKFLEQFNSSPNKENFYTPFAFLRLFADQFNLPEKVLYLDTDVVANDDISKLFNIDISNYELAWVKDYYGRVFINPKYCNSGVMLWNMTVLNQTKLLNRALKLCSTKKMFLADQTAINKLVKNALVLPRKFNEQKKIKADTVIRHFSMTIKFFPLITRQNIKPWNVSKVHSVLKIHQFDDILANYLARKEDIKKGEK